MMKVKKNSGNKKNLALILTLLLSIIAIQQKGYCSKVEIPGNYGGNVILVKVTDTRSKYMHVTGFLEPFITTLKTTTYKSSCWPCQRKSKEFKITTYGRMYDHESIYIASDTTTFPKDPPHDLTWSVTLEEEVTVELRERVLAVGFAGISSDRMELIRITENMISFDNNRFNICADVSSRHERGCTPLTIIHIRYADSDYLVPPPSRTETPL